MRADADGDGEINYEEFTSMMRAEARANCPRNMTSTGQSPEEQHEESSEQHGSLHSGDSHSSSMIPEVNDGTAMLRQFEEMTGTRHDYPKNGAPSLPPLQLSRATIAKRHIRDGAVAWQFMDRYLTRPTPHVLKTGLQPMLTALHPADKGAGHHPHA